MAVLLLIAVAVLICRTSFMRTTSRMLYPTDLGNDDETVVDLEQEASDLQSSIYTY